ncbi:uncharacterized protein PGTG_14235 [Puccinia graminis f. sp. tritici CRL 75-36-700-3]|uniref:Uncharacterized protein n=1 Tax=Puccinia graminis f. sp. tritici (strain CRL 75-36-700-3 / race SCCL) TaxID=418459 RepID=E3KX03_PUCGT|nr:uncharacterized protein PGTG_14235 [Puccinia graminis f. sp. tritici CRL 75-36-700-3]EFP88896.1 hypothetical protein PGTG_14235 [Puccinia graminis f. sp. tritici CRL 75-36-700-3]
MHPNTDEQDVSITSADGNKTTIDEPITDQGTSSSKKIFSVPFVYLDRNLATGTPGEAHGFTHEHGNQSTNHNEQVASAGGTAVEADELFTDEELADVFRVLFHPGGSAGIFRCSLTPGKIDQVIQELVATYDFTSPFNMHYIDTPEGKMPADYILEMMLKQWQATGYFSRWKYYYPDYLAFSSMEYDNDNFKALVGFIAGTESDNWTWTIIHQAY